MQVSKHINITRLTVDDALDVKYESIIQGKLSSVSGIRRMDNIWTLW